MLLFNFGLLFVIIFVKDAELVNTCGPDEFPCNDGSCVDKIKWCDTSIDCHDDSDELYCFFKSSLISNPNRCNESLFFLCDDGECIPAIGRCDGFSSCFDNSDEENCEVAESTSDDTANLTKPLKGHAEGFSISANVNESKTFGNFRENSMQADHVPHSDPSIVSETIEYSINGSNSSEHTSSNLNLKKTDQQLILSANISADVGNNASKNETNEDGVTPLVPMNHRKALEFRDLVGMLNASRRENDATTTHVNLDPVQSTISPSRNLNLKLDSGAKENHEIPNGKGNMSHHFDLHADQEHSVSAQKPVDKEEDLYKGYAKLRASIFQKVKDRALQWLIDSRDSDYGWGDETARGIIAVKMADYSSAKPGDMQLMSKQLHLKLFTLMSRNETERIPLGDLALYINALSASCDNPKNFHGYDLVSILRHRADIAEESSKYVTPFVYLVLCLHNSSTYSDVIELREMLNTWNITRIDNEAMMSLAATCISRTPKFSTIGIGRIAAKRLYHKVIKRGLPANIYELSLITQALNEARINQHLWNRTEAMHIITESQTKDGSFGDILSTYYAVPTLSGKSFLSISKICPAKSGFDPLEVLLNGKDEKMYVKYSLRFGDPLEVSQTLMMKVQKNTNFMDIMRIAATINPTYKFKYDMNEGKATVYSIGGIANDAERGLYWTPYTSRNSTIDLVPFAGDIQSFVPVFGEFVAYWRKPIF